MATEIERPECVTDDMLDWLDDVRDSGLINMMGAAAYIKDEFFLTRKESRAVVVYWMKTFGNREGSQ